MKLYICQSLDGYIAKKDGSIDFLDQFNDLIANSSNERIKNSYSNFMEDIENVVEGFATYNQIKEMGYGASYKKYNHYVLTRNHRDLEDGNVTKFISIDELEKLNLDEQSTFFVGGSQVIKHAFDRKLITTVIITGLPIMLGDGIKLFENVNTQVDLQIVDLFNDDKFYQIEYKVKYTDK